MATELQFIISMIVLATGLICGIIGAPVIVIGLALVAVLQKEGD